MGEPARKVDPLRPPKEHPRVRFEAPPAPELCGVNLRSHFKRLGVHSRNEREYLTQICLWSQRYGYAFAFQGTLGDKIGLSDRSVQTYQAKYALRGWLTVDRTGRENHVYPNWRTLGLENHSSDQTRENFGSPSLDDQPRPDREKTERADPAGTRPPSRTRARVEMPPGAPASSKIDPEGAQREDRPRPAPASPSGHRSDHTAARGSLEPTEPQEGVQTPGAPPVEPQPPSGDARAASGRLEGSPNGRRGRPEASVPPDPSRAALTAVWRLAGGADAVRMLLRAKLAPDELARATARILREPRTNAAGFVRACVMPDLEKAREVAEARACEEEVFARQACAWMGDLGAAADGELRRLDEELSHRLWRAQGDPEQQDRVERMLRKVQGERERRGLRARERAPRSATSTAGDGGATLADCIRAVMAGLDPPAPEPDTPPAPRDERPRPVTLVGDKKPRDPRSVDVFWQMIPKE